MEHLSGPSPYADTAEAAPLGIEFQVSFLDWIHLKFARYSQSYDALSQCIAPNLTNQPAWFSIWFGK